MRTQALDKEKQEAEKKEEVKVEQEPEAEAEVDPNATAEMDESVAVNEEAVNVKKKRKREKVVTHSFTHSLMCLLTYSLTLLGGQ